MNKEFRHYASLLEEIRDRIRQAQVSAVLSANREMLLLYWDVGRMIHMRQKEEGWGAGVIPRLSRDLQNELPEIKGYSERNLKRMIRFYREYPLLRTKVPQPVAQLPDQATGIKVPQPVAQLPEKNKLPNLQRLVAQIPWGHNILLMEKVKDLPTRLWYVQQSLENGWSRNVLALMIKGRAHERQGRAVTNFDLLLPPPQSDMAKQTLKDPYIFDFLTLDAPFRERELELGLIRHLEKFLLELG